jgi:uncharacterized protein (DUF58 family)
VRRALGGLTVRGRGFVAAGATVLVIGLFSRQPDIVRVSVFLLACPLLSLAMVSSARLRMAARRDLAPARIAAGESARVTLTVENQGRLPTGVLLFEDELPYTLGAGPRFVVDRLAPQTARSVAYNLNCERRGRYRLGPLRMRLVDPFGLCELTRSFTATHRLVVTPRVEPLPQVGLSGEWAGGGEEVLRLVAAQGEDDVTTRPYRLGDELRRIHWPTTARLGQLAVRREEQPWQARAVLLLDTRRRAHRGDGSASSFEFAVGAAASIGMDLGGRGFGVRAISDTGAELTDTEDLLDALAGVEGSTGRFLEPGLQALRRDGGEGLAVAIVGRLEAEDVDELAQFRHLVGWGVLVAVNPPEADGPALGGWYDQLVDAGWRVLLARKGTSLATLWAAAGRRVERPLPVGELGAVGARGHLRGVSG